MCDFAKSLKNHEPVKLPGRWATDLSLRLNLYLFARGVSMNAISITNICVAIQCDWKN